MTTNTTHKSDHFVIGRNYNDPNLTQLRDAVYVNFTGQYSYQDGQSFRGIGTQEAREAGRALIKLADQIDREVAEREAAKIPEEPKGDIVIIKFPNMVPATRTRHDGKWSFLTGSVRPTEYTWAEVVQRGGHDFEVLYTL